MFLLEMKIFWNFHDNLVKHGGMEIVIHILLTHLEAILFWLPCALFVMDRDKQTMLTLSTIIGGEKHYLIVLSLLNYIIIICVLIFGFYF